MTASLEIKINQLSDENAALTRIIAQLRTEVHRLRLLHSQIELEERIASLPVASQQRLRAAFPGTDLGGLKQAVNAERRLQPNKQDRRVERILG